jgi:hypothetical protein
MAVIEIAKIQVRRGQENQTGIPQLAGGEFAWAEDTENLYIGLKREDGGARDANIRVLTENDVNLFRAMASEGMLNTATNYIWESNSNDTITSTSTVDGSIVRLVQDKLDDFVNVADFGVISSTSTEVNDCSIELQLAIDNLFLGKNVEWNNEDYSNTLQYNKRLYFPAGIYKIGETIFIPKNTVIVGEGIDKTIIEVITTGSSAFQTVDYNNRRNDYTLGKFDATTSTNTDSITNSGRPKNIHIEGMTVRYSTSTGLTPHLSLISLDCVDNAVIREVKFQGNDTWSSPTSNPDYTGIDIRGYSAAYRPIAGALTSENILIDNCQFTGLYYDIKSNYDTNHIVIQNSSFTDSKYGIAFSTTTNSVSLTGPTYARMVNNKFNNIYGQGIYVGANRSGVSTNHVSENNSFVRVGDQGITEGSASTGTSVIKFATAGNASVNDYFGRQQYHNLNLAATTATTYYPLIDGKSTIDVNAVTTATLVAGPSINHAWAETSIMRLPITGNEQNLTIKYQCKGTGINKAGTLQIYIRPGTTPTDVQVSDEYNIYGNDGGIFWGVDVSTSTKHFDIIGCNLALTPVQVELQTKLML